MVLNYDLGDKFLQIFDLRPTIYGEDLKKKVHRGYFILFLTENILYLRYRRFDSGDFVRQ